jgi:hypothetical protein
VIKLLFAATLLLGGVYVVVVGVGEGEPYLASGGAVVFLLGAYIVGRESGK